jgi:hypothetical protein
MKSTAKSIRSFIGAKNYRESQAFYNDLGWQIVELGSDMCLVKVNESLGFYLQDAYVEDWVNNSMIFLEVDDLDQYDAELATKNLPGKYPRVRISAIQNLDWGRELFLHDPSGVLWHIGQFAK